VRCFKTTDDVTALKDCASVSKCASVSSQECPLDCKPRSSKPKTANPAENPHQVILCEV
jgi:hypothetical protein